MINETESDDDYLTSGFRTSFLTGKQLIKKDLCLFSCFGGVGDIVGLVDPQYLYKEYLSSAQTYHIGGL